MCFYPNIYAKPKPDCCEPTPICPPPCCAPGVALLKAVSLTEQTVAAGSDVVFSNVTIQRGRAANHTPGDGVFAVRKSGLYRVTFRLNYTAAADGVATVQVSGYPTTRVALTVAQNTPNTIAGTDLLQLAEGERVSLQYAQGSTAGALTVSNAVLVLELLDTQDEAIVC